MNQPQENRADRVRQFLATAGENLPQTPESGAEQTLIERDGLMERTEYVNPRVVDTKGRQLLREELFETINE